MGFRSTTVEIILYYLTILIGTIVETSTTVEIILYYLTIKIVGYIPISTTVEIILYYLTILNVLEVVHYLQQ